MTPDNNKVNEEEIKYDTNFSFGDIVENYWASEKNPHRTGIVVRVFRKSIQCTDGRGDFWELVNDKSSKTKIIGHYSDKKPVPESLPDVTVKKSDFQIAWDIALSKDKPFFIDSFRDLLTLYDKEEISLSKFVEELNVVAYKWQKIQQGQEAVAFVEWIDKNEYMKMLPENTWVKGEYNTADVDTDKEYTTEQLYQLFKQQSK